jgi:amino-acid N-acetyltransferase
MEIKLRRARAADVEAVQRLVNSFADRGEMLPRSLNELYENVRDLFVAEAEGEVIGCCALHVTWGDLAEIKCLAVREGHRGKGLGGRLVEACLADAQELALGRVFVLTYIPDYFERFGFRRVEKAELPQKVWSECIRCPKFPDCGEVSLVLGVGG